MLLQKKFPKLDDPEFYLDFTSRYARRGESFFDTLEIWCSLFGILLPIMLTWFLFAAGVGETREMHNVPFVYWILIIASFLVQIRILWHINKERPRWRIARYYQNIARNDIYGLEKEVRYADSAEKVEMLINHILAFQKKFPIKENALVAIIYNECLVARGLYPQALPITRIERLFPRFTAFLGSKTVRTAVGG